VIAQSLHFPRTGPLKSPSTGRSQAAARSLPARRGSAHDSNNQAIAVTGIARDIQVKFASEPDEWRQAFALVAANYRARGYDVPGAPPYRFTSYHALPNTAIAVAKHGERVVATLSLVPDTTLLGLPLENVFPTEVARLRKQGRCLAEATSLADTDLSLREFVRVFRTLIKLVMQHHLSRGGDSWVIAIHPRHRCFYQRAFGFVPLGPCRAYPEVEDHPAEAYMLDVESMKRNAPDTHLEVFGETLPAHLLATQGWSPELVRYFGSRSCRTDGETIDAILHSVTHFGSQRRW
jgi:hypothetical protein